MIDYASFSAEKRLQIMDLMHEPDITILMAKLKDKDKYVRYWAAYALGKKREVSSIPALIETLRDMQPVRGIAAVALQFIGSPSVPALIQALQGTNGNVRCLAAETLGLIRDASAVPSLSQALNDK